MIFESTEDAAFDARMTQKLFPHFDRKVNSISAGNKQRVTELYQILNRAADQHVLPAKFFTITDLDTDTPVPVPNPTRVFKWDVYHIENYLLEPNTILRVLRAIDSPRWNSRNVEDVESALKSCAAQCVPALVEIKLRSRVNSAVVNCIDLGFDPKRTDIGVAMNEAVQRTSNALRRKVEDDLTSERLRELEDELRKELQAALQTAAWMRVIRGRDILNKFVELHGGGMKYAHFRDIIISYIRDAHYEPPGMKRVVDAILSA